MHWYGGEYISGTAAAFAALSEKIDQVWPVYLSNIKLLKHVGDEPVVSAAICILQSEGVVQVREAGPDAGLNRVARWWTARTERKQRRLRELSHVSMLHLPADKPFLFKYRHSFDSKKFMRDYRRHVMQKSLMRMPASWADRLRGRKAKYVAML